MRCPKRTEAPDQPAQRIRARAIRRAGELLKQIEPAPTGPKPELKAGDRPQFGRADAARNAGMSPHQAKQATRIANVPEREFEAQVEADKPPTLSQLASQDTTMPIKSEADLEARMTVKLKDAKRVVFDHVAKAEREAGVVDLQELSKDMENFSEGDLRLTILMEGDVSGDLWPIAIALARGELARREANDMKSLAYRTTFISAGIGAFAALAGTVLGALL